MVKSKKPKKQVNLQPEYVLDPKAQQVHKKKKKNAPDRPQPEWMFPPDEENPVLNPRTKSQEAQEKDKNDHDQAVKFLKYKSVTTPVKAPPPAVLLTLVGAFLTSYGFNSTSRLYTTELASRKKLEEWEVLLDEKLPKGFPDLVKLFKVGQKTYDEQKREEETSSSDEDDDDERKAYKKTRKEVKTGRKATPETEETSSSGSEDSSEDDDSDVEMEEAPPVTKLASDAAKKSSRSDISSLATSSDSDADDEKEPAGAQLPTTQPLQNVKKAAKTAKRPAEPKVDEPAKVKVRGRGGVGPVKLPSNEETSPDDNESEEGKVEAVIEAIKAKVEPIKSTSVQTTESDSDSSSSSSESDSPPDILIAPLPTATITTTTIETITAKKPHNGSSSSETVQGATDQKTTTAETSFSSSISSSSPSASSPDREEAPPPPPTQTKTKTSNPTTKRKRNNDDEEGNDEPASPRKPPKQNKTKTTNAPFERVPKDTPIDARFDNKYKSYDYADRAYQDLSVTRGKGFTKEKNKKKKGSYRGGVIDTGGGKSVKFED